MRILRIYDRGMRFMGEIGDYSSLVWTPRFQEPGEFSVAALATEENCRLLTAGSFAWVRGEKECALIESIAIEEDEDGSEIQASGRFASALMDKRRIRGKPYTYAGAAEAAFAPLFSACMPLFSQEDGITFLLSDAPEGHTPVRFQATYRSLLSYVQRLCKTLGRGFRLRPDFSRRSMTFETYAGRTSPAVFSEAYENLLSASYSEERQDYANVCYVGGSGDGEDRVFASAGDTSAAGFLRRECLLESSNSPPEGTGDGEYEEQLRQAGRDALAQEHAVYKSIACEVNAETPFRFGTDWDLGDDVRIRKSEWGIDERMRVTEISIVTENGITRVIPTLGQPAPEKIEWEDSD